MRGLVSSAVAAALVAPIAVAALPAGAGTLPTGFGGPTVDVLPGNAPPGYKRTQDLPIAIRLSADRTRIAELDWALISACNFEARIDWGKLTDIPVASDGTFAVHQDYPLRGEGATAVLDVNGRLGAGRIDGSTRLDASAADECGGATTWTATPAFAGTSSQGTPAVVQLSADRKRIARFMAVWIPHCRGGAGLDPPQNAIGFDQRHLARLSSGRRFTSHRAATTLQTTAEVEVVREALSGRVAGTKLTGTFRTTIKLSRIYSCASKSVSFALAS